MFKVSAPGKLMMAGEWAVLEPGNPCIVAAVNKRVYSEIKESGEIEVTIPEFGIRNAKGAFSGNKFSWFGKVDEEKLVFTKSAIETALRFLGESKPFNLVSYGKDTQIKTENGLKKVGFGSSAAAVVSNIAVILKFNGVDISKKESMDIIYKLSALAHYYAQGRLGSAFDIAASVYGGVIVYKRFDPEWVTKKIESGAAVRDIVNTTWPGFFVDRLNIPAGFNLNVFWTGDSASTSSMIKQMAEFKKSDSKKYAELYNQIRETVNELVTAWKEGNENKIITLLNKNEDILRDLTKKSGIGIETVQLRKLSETAKSLDTAGKLSGAGGGDCGIIVCFDKKLSEKIKAELSKEKLIVVDAEIDIDGVKLDGLD